ISRLFARPFPARSARSLPKASEIAPMFTGTGMPAAKLLRISNEFRKKTSSKRDNNIVFRVGSALEGRLPDRHCGLRRIPDKTDLAHGFPNCSEFSPRCSDREEVVGVRAMDRFHRNWREAVISIPATIKLII